MSYTIKVINSVEMVSPLEWDRLGKGVPFASHRWYRYGEAVLINDKPYYLIVMDGDHQVARATLWLRKEEALPVSSRLVSKGINQIFARWPLLNCSSPLATTGGLILPDSADAADMLSLMMKELREIMQREQVSFVTFDFLNGKQSDQIEARSEMLPIALPEQGTQLQIRWSTFEDYLKILSKNDRKSYKRAVRKAERLGITVRALPKVNEIDTAMNLITAHDERYKTLTLPWARLMLEKAPMVDAIWLAAYVGEKLIACGLLLGDQGTWLATGLGRDHNYDYAYFVLGYEAIRHVIESHGKTLRWGTGAYEYKKRLGFELEDNHFVCFQARNPAIDWIFRKLAGKLV